VSFVAWQGEEFAAVLQFETLAWDTKVIGLPVARITWLIDYPHTDDRSSIRTEMVRRAISEAQQCGTRYLLARIPSGDVEAIHILEGSGFRLLEGLLTFGTSLEAEPPSSEKHHELRCRPFLPEDIPTLRELAGNSFSMDRFHSDPGIEKTKADEIHQQWIENSCEGFADCVLVAENSRPIGFTTLKIDSASENHLGVRVGVVVLVATSSQHRRKGVARLLTIAALRWFRQARCQWVEVGTQLANIHASRVYQAAGFRLVRSSLTFRKLL
jgi:GNAT superfamily N-acetyltransferase